MTHAPSATTPAPTSRRDALLAAVATVAVPLVVLAGFLLWAAHDSVPLGTVARAVLAIALTQVLPGVVLWRLVRPRDGWLLEDLAFGFAVGSALAITFQIPAGLLGTHWLSAVLCLATAVVVLAIPASRRRVLAARWAPVPWWWGGAVVLPSLFAVPELRAYFDQNMVVWSGGGFRAPHVDTQLHLSLAAQLLERGPTKFPWVESEDLGYHFLSHAWVAQVSATSGAGIDQVLLRIMPAVFPAIVAVTLGVAALRLTRVTWAGPVAAFLVFAAGRVNPIGAVMTLAPITPLSPSVAPSVGILVVLVVLMVLRWRGEVPVWSTLPLVYFLAVIAAGTKGATTPLVVAGTALALAAMLLFDRSRWKLLLVDLVVVTAALQTAVRLVFRGSGVGLHASLRDAANQTWVADRAGLSTGTAYDLIASTTAVTTTLTAGALGLLFIFFKDLRSRPEWWLMGGAIVAGAGAVGVFAHPGRSQGYFAVAAKPLMVLATTAMIVELVRRIPRPVLVRMVVPGLVGGIGVLWIVPALIYSSSKRVEILTSLAVGLAVLVAAGVVAALVVGRDRLALGVGAVTVAVLAAGTVTGGQATTLHFDPHEDVSRTNPLAESMQMVRAARYIRNHSDREALVMTNMHCLTITEDPLDGCDNRWMFVAAYAERQVLVEGWTATPRSAEEAPEGRDLMVAPYWYPDVLQLNDRFIAQPTEADARDLWDRGVRWVFADHRRPWSRDLRSYADLRFHNRDAHVYQLRQP